MAIDVFHPSGIIANHARVGAKAFELSALAKVDAKNTTYTNMCVARGVDFMAIAVGAFRGWLPPAEAVINKLAARLAKRSGMVQ